MMSIKMGNGILEGYRFLGNPVPIELGYGFLS
jgi:hypothetical protein